MTSGSAAAAPAETSREGEWVIPFLYFAVLLVLTTVLFPLGTRPDEPLAFSTFSQTLLGRPDGNEVIIRVALSAFNISLFWLLTSTGLIDRRAAKFAMIWPMTAFLFSKIYWEFFVFPLALIRTDLTARREFGVFAVLFVGLYWTGEGNLVVVLLFRTAMVAHRKLPGLIVPGTIAVTGVVLDRAMTTGVAQSLPFVGPHVQRFSYTRAIANPEYSVFETAQVFGASLHFFALHTGPVLVSMTFTLLVVLLFASFEEARRKARDLRNEIFVFVSVLFFFTAVTHAFQNVRYYYFVIPLLAKLFPTKGYAALLLLSLMHVTVYAAFFPSFL